MVMAAKTAVPVEIGCHQVNREIINNEKRLFEEGQNII